MRPRLFHLPLEAYRERYTEFLSIWERSEFANRFDVTDIRPSTEWRPTLIKTGEVLDSVRRPIWAMSQIQQLLQHPDAQEGGIVYLSDFYHPGLDALAYSRRKFHLASFCWAQTVDQYDFTYKYFLTWMRHWEQMALSMYSVVFVACPEMEELLRVVFARVAPQSQVDIFSVGLPYNSDFVKSIVAQAKPSDQSYDVAYTSRWDEEKSPIVFCGLVETRPDLRFVVCSGADQLRGDSTAINQIHELAQKQGNVTFKLGLTKRDYYATLAASKVQFNCAKQDWISFTLLDALTMRCLPLYPAHRSFPKAFSYNEQYLYAPNSVKSASAKLDALLALKESGEAYPQDLLRLLEYHNRTLTRMTALL